MAEKSIIWSERAISELKETLAFYAERNGNTDYSLKILDKTEKLLKTLKENEFIGRLANNKRTRVIVLDVYLPILRNTKHSNRNFIFLGQ